MSNFVKCEYYKSKEEQFQSNEIKSTRSKLEPHYISNEWCAHTNSPHRELEKGTFECKGDKKKCPLA